MAAGEIWNALDLTVASLKGGVLRLGVGPALPEISAWKERLAASGNADLEAVAGTLGELEAQLDPSGLDPVSFGALLTSLGEQVRGVAGAEIGAQVGDRLSRLGALLGSEGRALTDETTRV